MGELLRRANLELGGAVPQRTPHSGTVFNFFFLRKKKQKSQDRCRKKKIGNVFSTQHTNWNIDSATTARGILDPYHGTVCTAVFSLSNIYGIDSHNSIKDTEQL